MKDPMFSILAVWKRRCQNIVHTTRFDQVIWPPPV